MNASRPFSLINPDSSTVTNTNSLDELKPSTPFQKATTSNYATFGERSAATPRSFIIPSHQRPPPLQPVCATYDSNNSKLRKVGHKYFTSMQRRGIFFRKARRHHKSSALFSECMKPVHDFLLCVCKVELKRGGCDEADLLL